VWQGKEQVALLSLGTHHLTFRSCAELPPIRRLEVSVESVMSSVRSPHPVQYEDLA
jgi:hypothetical protein